MSSPAADWLILIIEPKPIKGGNLKKPAVTSCRVERGLASPWRVWHYEDALDSLFSETASHERISIDIGFISRRAS